MQETITQIRRFPDSGHVPVELDDFADDTFRQVLSGKNRVIYQVRDDILYIHLVCDTRRDLQALLQRIVLRLI
ncbi:plasmid stabilization protein [Burkholderia sp. KK1]|nr:plasmid stabilization protein [Burkholderia sp. KK1]